MILVFSFLVLAFCTLSADVGSKVDENREHDLEFVSVNGRLMWSTTIDEKVGKSSLEPGPNPDDARDGHTTWTQTDRTNIIFILSVFVYMVMLRTLQDMKRMRGWSKVGMGDGWGSGRFVETLIEGERDLDEVDNRNKITNPLVIAWVY
ncbi:hypothetical protein EV361DRAFT_869555 [Lentinula raphanica]|nr:hypothetical protein EV361DRAFT_869555 [Lentinula raphanica]